MGPWEMEDHLINMHDIGKFTARRVTRSISLSMPGGYREGIPPDGLEAQKGLAVFDGLRCARCGKCKTRVLGEVEQHWYDTGHGHTKGSVVELVRLQSWGDRKGGQGGYWVVREGKKSGSGARLELRRREHEAMEEAAPAEATPMEEKVEEEAPAAEEAPAEEEAPAAEEIVEEAPPAEEIVEEDVPAEEESMEEAPVEEIDLEEIPDNITEESECWSSEEGGQEKREGREDKGSLDGWEGDCFGWR